MGDDYDNYLDALNANDMTTLHQRREERCLSFARKCLKHPMHSKLFPLNTNNVGNLHISRDKYIVNHDRTEIYRDSAIPYL